MRVMPLHLYISFEQLGHLSVSSAIVNCATQVGDSCNPSYPRFLQLSRLVSNYLLGIKKLGFPGYLGRPEAPLLDAVGLSNEGAR